MLGIFLLFWSLSTTPGIRRVDLPRARASTRTCSTARCSGACAVATLVTLLLFVGATGKSAQIPLYVWLPDAMAGPTPVAALIHAATMVTAGVYMIGRLNFLFAMAPVTLARRRRGSARATALFAATIGAGAERHQEGAGVLDRQPARLHVHRAWASAPTRAGIFHLMTHAFFKACLFLGSGSVIHAMGGEQDMRKMGGLQAVDAAHVLDLPDLDARASPASRRSPGFFSKDEILWQALLEPRTAARCSGLIGLVGAGLTAFYMFRQVFMTFFGESRADHHTQRAPARVAGGR